MPDSGMLSIDVSLDRASYGVWIGDGLLAHCGEKIRPLHKGSKVAVVTDENVAPLYSETVLQSLDDAGFEAHLLAVEPGEKSKSLECAGRLCERMIALGLDRSALLIALGGGVVGDLAGFVAAIYYRGVPFVQAPTTVVAQVDSSVGGKTGVNAKGGKNLIGAFHQPVMVIADPTTLVSLPEREFNEGFAEVIKHAAIRDPEMLDMLDPERRTGLSELVARNVGIKAAVVAADERETSGERALLNFGHTIGHALEKAGGYGRFLHGEAISIGLHAALRLSVKKAALAESDCERVVAALETFRLPVRIPADLSTEAILAAMAHDKKFKEGAIRFVLVEKLGSAFLSNAVSSEDIEAVIRELRV